MCAPSWRSFATIPLPEHPYQDVQEDIQLVGIAVGFMGLGLLGHPEYVDRYSS
jgi:hypothetical protein